MDDRLVDHQHQMDLGGGGGGSIVEMSILTAIRFCLRAFASATFLMGRASMALRRSFSA